MSAIVWIAIGAALMYFFDPASGRARRAWLRAKCDQVAKKGTAAAPTTATDPRRTIPEQSITEAPTSGGAGETLSGEGLRGHVPGSDIADERGDSATKVQL
ncbi:MAG: hypothetical protein ACT4QB_14865 [Gammaproteobacteria bacterium]